MCPLKRFSQLAEKQGSLVILGEACPPQASEESLFATSP